MRRVASLSLALLLACTFAPACAKVDAPANRTTARIRMKDGVELATDFYQPKGKGPWPVVLMRTPYNKNACAAIGAATTAGGIVLVAQDTRGRFASQGENIPFDGDGWWEGRQDGIDTLNWIVAQPWCNGKIVTYGGSALGIAQLLAAGAGTDKIAAQIIQVGAPSLYFDCAYRDGILRKALVEDWTRGAAYSKDAAKLWASHPSYDAFWKTRDVRFRYSRVNAPAIHMGGWYDIFAQGTLDSFEGYQKHGGVRARGHQKLIMGPWTHALMTERAGQLQFPEGNQPPGKIADAIQWIAHYGGGADNGIDRAPAVTYYVMGDADDKASPGNRWRTSDVWPPKSHAQKLYLRTSGTAGTEAPEQDAPPREYTYDPANPAPTMGGAQLTIPAGPMDQRPVEARPDVLVYTTTPLDSPVEVTGRIRATLWISSDCPDTDFFVRLCDVYPDGRSMSVCEGALRTRFRQSFTTEKLLTPGTVYPLSIDLWSTSIVFSKGHRMRVDITSSCSPGYSPNPNTGDAIGSSTRTRIARNRVLSNRTRPSSVLLPVVSGDLPR